MANVLVRDLPDDVHRKLLKRAEAAGQSLQQYLSRALVDLADTPTMGEILSRISTRRGGRVGFQHALEDLHDARGER